MSESLLEVRDLSIQYSTRTGVVRAVREVDLLVREQGSFGVVGESGSGKSTLFLGVMGLLPPAATKVRGRAMFAGRDLLSLDEEQMRQIRGREIATIFQDPTSSLHPMHTIGWQVAEAIWSHESVSRRVRRDRTLEALREVGMPEPERTSRQFPHELSGGMRQRALIAVALVLRPRLILADEPTTALDVTVQAQVLEVLERVRAEVGAALVLITHDLSVIAQRTEDSAVMHNGRIVEAGRTSTIFTSPQHPYTRSLLEAIPRHDRPRERILPFIPGQPPAASDEETGCSFAPRCVHAQPRCRTERPLLRQARSGSEVACHFSEQLSLHLAGR